MNRVDQPTRLLGARSALGGTGHAHLAHPHDIRGRSAVRDNVHWVVFGVCSPWWRSTEGLFDRVVHPMLTFGAVVSGLSASASADRRCVGRG